MIHALEIAMGTPPFPDTKTVECQSCGNQEEVDRKTTEWECPNCGTLNRFFSLREGRRVKRPKGLYCKICVGVFKIPGAKNLFIGARLPPLHPQR